MVFARRLVAHACGSSPICCNSNPKRGNVFGDDHPYNVVGNPMVFVAQDVADAANLLPWNIRRDRQQFVWNVAGCFEMISKAR